MKKNLRGIFCILIAIAMLFTGGCSLKSMFSNEPATPADCAAIAAYIELCSTEAINSSLPKETRVWYQLALAGARIEQARKCAGVE